MKLKLVNAKGATISMTAQRIKLEGAKMTVYFADGSLLYMGLGGVEKTWWASDVEGGEFTSWEVTS